jgi:isocitrate dehydrogenase kinase/phosphatase
MSTTISTEAKEAAAIIRDSFQQFYGIFDELTVHAKDRFRQRQWKEQREAVRKRILLHDKAIEETAHRLFNFQLLGKGWWTSVASEYDKVTNHNPLAQTFLDAVGRIYFKGDVAFTLFDPLKVEISVSEKYLEKIIVHRPFHGWVTDFLQKIGIEITEQSLQKPSEKIASLFSEKVIQSEEATLFFYPDLFYRNKHAYLMGYAMDGEKQVPLLLAFTNTENGIILDALLYEEEDIKNVFAFSRSYFLVATTHAKALVDLLLKVMPSKPESQLYMNLGYQEHGKELVIRLLQQHLQNHRSQFVVAPGIAGMVMMVFTLPDYDLVFKLIRDKFRPPKSVTREEVIEKYRFIALHDRVGRLADAQRFEYLGLPLAYFDSQLLAYLLAECSESVSVRNGIVCFQDIYTERKMIPLNLYFEQTAPAKAEQAVRDFGNAIREMALSNIFPGDLLIKNFGVTTEDRVVFYDYDEIVPLVDCTFKDIPKARNDEDEMSAEPWFAVNENDIFPQELVKFLLPEGTLRDKFAAHHQELYTAAFWNDLKQFHQRGELVDIQPYKSNLI